MGKFAYNNLPIHDAEIHEQPQPKDSLRRSAQKPSSDQRFIDYACVTIYCRFNKVMNAAKPIEKVNAMAVPGTIGAFLGAVAFVTYQYFCGKETMNEVDLVLQIVRKTVVGSFGVFVGALIASKIKKRHSR